MNALDYLNSLTERDFFSVYTVQHDASYQGRTFPICGHFDLTGERPLIFGFGKAPSKQCLEYLFLDACECIDEAYLHSLMEWVSSAEGAIVHPHPEHLATYFTVVAASEKISPNLKRAVKKCKMEKQYARGKDGFFSFRLLVVNSETGELLTNSSGSDLKSRYAVSVSSF